MYNSEKTPDTVKLVIRMPTTLKKKLYSQAKKHDISASKLIRVILAEGVKKLKG